MTFIMALSIYYETEKAQTGCFFAHFAFSVRKWLIHYLHYL